MKISEVSFTEYLSAFTAIQEIIVPITEALGNNITSGMSEREIAQEYDILLRSAGFTDHWYPLLVCAGSWSGQPMTRRVHLPSDSVFVRSDDIVILDSTPLLGTVWGNWSKAFSIGTGSFYNELCRQGEAVTQETAEFAASEADTIGDIFDFCMKKINDAGLMLLDSRADVGHSIFQVPEGQTVEKTPHSNRLFISEEYRDIKLQGILSIEPQVGRRNADGTMYGVKQQRVVVYTNSLDSGKTTGVILPSHY